MNVLFLNSSPLVVNTPTARCVKKKSTIYTVVSDTHFVDKILVIEGCWSYRSYTASAINYRPLSTVKQNHVLQSTSIIHKIFYTPGNF